MNDRIEKKLSKRIVELLPKTYARDAWEDDYGCMVIGGEDDGWGNTTDVYSVLDDLSGYEWWGMFGEHPHCHNFAYSPLLDPKKPTGKRVIQMAKLVAENGERAFKTAVLKGRMYGDQ